MNRVFRLLLLLIVIATVVSGQPEMIDSAAIARIRDEGMNRSQVMEILSYLTDVYGPRLTGSPGYVRSAEWARTKLASWNLENAHLEAWGPFGKGWTLKRYSANVIGRQVFPLLSYPKAWSTGTDGKVTGEVVYLDAATDSALDTYKGKLRNKFILWGNVREVKAQFIPPAKRENDSSLLVLANADAPKPRRPRPEPTDEQKAEQKKRAMLNYRKWLMCEEEGALGILSSSWGDGGNMMFVQQASVPSHPDTPWTNSPRSYSQNAPEILPQVSVGVEHFQRMVRMLQKGESVKLEMNLEVEFNDADSCYNVIAEIPGADLNDEVVMIGGHLDSWHAASGTTDNGTGVAVCMEAVRILKALDLKPRRTIRIALWGGEEQGMFGSSGYVKKHFGEKLPDGEIRLTPEAEKFSAYFNDDNGTGKFRGIYMEGNEAARPIFRSWLAPFADLGASTVTLAATGSTDHEPFKAIGLPGFQFIQDDVEYSSRSWHSSMDFYERAQPEDLKQSSIIMAAFAYNAAMRDEKFPRKPAPPVEAAAGGH